MNDFVRPAQHYHRDMDILSAYQRDMAYGLHCVTGQPLEKCQQYMKRVIDNKTRFTFHDPNIQVVARNQVGDRVIKQTTFLQYLRVINQNDLILAPSLTAYKNPDQQRSVTAMYIAENVKKRKQVKREMFEAKRNGDQALKDYKNNEQKTRKIKANALSGAHCSISTILYHPTIHSTLTSTCRSASGYGNAHNERLLSGNRHYWHADIVTANILSVIHHVDFDLLQQVVDHYQLHLPTTDETIACIHHSSDCYWVNDHKMQVIRCLIASLSPIERAAFVYTGDLYHLRVYNPQLIRDLIQRLSYRDDQPIDQPAQYLQGMSEEMQVLLAMLCAPYMQGEVLADFENFSESTQQIIGSTAKNLHESLNDYQLLIRAVLVTDAMPPTVANLPSILRRSAVTSDTDSTIYTVQDWIEWYYGGLVFNEAAERIGHAVSFLSSASVPHTLAKMSANMGVRENQIFQYTMKSEFYFPIFTLTSRAKVYFASIAAQEGQVFSQYDYEIKGAVLQASNSPQFIADDIKDLVKTLLNIAEGNRISLQVVLERISYIEQQIYNGIYAGDLRFYKRGEIKPADSYKLSVSQSPYFHHLLWQGAFAPYYGSINEPPYESVRVTMNISSNRDFREWVEQMPTDMGEAIISIIKEHNKGPISTIQIPRAMVEQNGVPQEIINALSVRDIIVNLMEPYYVILESLGYYSLDNHRLRMVSDRYQAINHPLSAIQAD